MISCHRRALLRHAFDGEGAEFSILIANFPQRLIIRVVQSRSRKSAQDDKWSFCLTAGTLWPANQERP